MVKNKRIGNKPGPAYIHAAAKGWYCTPNRSLYVSEGGAIARWLNQSACQNCLRKYQVRHPNLKVADKLIRAAGKLSGDKLDLHVCGQADAMLEKAPPADHVVAPPMKMCINCGNMATLSASCDCGNTMADKDGRVLVNVTQFEVSGSRFRASLNMPGYPEMRIAFPKDKIKPSELLKVREEEDNQKTIAISVPADSLKNQIKRSIEK
jgi:hypothetical protein